MPSRKPRVALTMPEDLNALFERISDLNGTPKTRLIVELLQAYEPVLTEMLDTLEKIHADKENAQKIVKQFGQNLVMEASSILGDVSKEVQDLSLITFQGFFLVNTTLASSFQAWLCLLIHWVIKNGYAIKNFLLRVLIHPKFSFSHILKI